MSRLVVSGSGYAAGEQISVLFHTETIALARADSACAFEVNAKISGIFDAFRARQLTITAIGNSGARHARAPFQLQVTGGGVSNAGPARITLPATTGKSGTKVTVTGESFAASEGAHPLPHRRDQRSRRGHQGLVRPKVFTIPGSFDRFAP